MPGYLNPIESEIMEYFQDYYKKVDEKFLQFAYSYLSTNKEFEPIEYRFLSWLNYAFGFAVSINTPSIPNIQIISLLDFEKQYLFSERRKYLYSILLEFIEIISKPYSSSRFEIIIGGSFLDKDKLDPNDIDGCILVNPEIYFNNDDFNENYLLASGIYLPKVDVRFLPSNYNIKVFKAYSTLINLGNKVMDKSLKTTINNLYQKIDLFKILLKS